jgi:hypothetical protein
MEADCSESSVRGYYSAFMKDDLVQVSRQKVSRSYVDDSKSSCRLDLSMKGRRCEFPSLA